MNDQLIIGDKASFDDFEASLAARNIGMPKKKSVKETVPFSNVTYDFSRINGELYWEDRPLEYVFEILASTPEELEELKTAFSSWVMNVFEEEIHDPFIPDYHFIGTYEDIDFEDEETLDKTTVTVKFTAYPYKVANLPTVFELKSNDRYASEWFIENNSAHRVKARFNLAFDRTDSSLKYCIFYINETTSCRVNDKETIEVLLPPGTVKIVGDGTPDILTFTCEVTFTEEVF